MLREAWRKWRVNFLGRGWGGVEEEDIFWGVLGFLVGWLVDLLMYRGGMDGNIPPGGERDWRDDLNLFVG